MHCTSKALLSSVFGTALHRPSLSLPPFLLPAFAAASFSTTSALQKRRERRRDGNPARGVSALRRTGLRRAGPSTRMRTLPQPVLDRDKHSEVKVDHDHGLWGFFREDRAALATPLELSEHGRAWTVQELRVKDWDDLHRLWWVCLRERNRIATMDRERQRLHAGHGAYEAEQRNKEISNTMKAIKFVLTERWYTWENARVAAMEDEEIDLYASGEAVYTPKGDSEDEFGPDHDEDEDDEIAENGSSQQPSLPVPDVAAPRPEARM